MSVVAPRGASALFPSSYFAAPNQEGTVFSWRSSGGPVVRTMALTLTPGDMPVNEFQRNFQLAWRVRAGVDAISVDYLVDAIGVQQISLPCDAVDVSLLAERPNPLEAYQPPRFTLRATVCIADGATSSRSATYTSQFSVASLAAVTIPIPKGARAWRLAGTDLVGVSTLFSPLVVCSIAGNQGQVRINGFVLAQLSATDGFLPLMGQALGGLVITNFNTGTVGGYVIWELDL